VAKLAAIVEYDGSGFAGWQQQEHAPSVQQELESALGFVAGHPVSAVCAGRTDAGVHAVAQVIHFETSADRSPRSWMLGTNSRLPPEISLGWISGVSADFHARHRATRRTYRYYILNRSARSALLAGRVAWIHRMLDAGLMQEAAQVLLGEQDFSAFRSVECQSRTPLRHLDRIEVRRSGDHLCVEIRANGFLHHMVRNIVGTLVGLSGTPQAAQELRRILEGRDRRLAGPTAPACGLYFWQADYPAHFGIPPTLAPTPLLGL